MPYTKKELEQMEKVLGVEVGPGPAMHVHKPVVTQVAPATVISPAIKTPLQKTVCYPELSLSNKGYNSIPDLSGKEIYTLFLNNNVIKKILSSC